MPVRQSRQTKAARISLLGWRDGWDPNAKEPALVYQPDRTETVMTVIYLDVEEITLPAFLDLDDVRAALRNRSVAWTL